MLILSRKQGEVIVINGGPETGEIQVEVIEIKGQSVRLGVLAKREVAVDRLEVAEAKRLNPRTLD